MVYSNTKITSQAVQPNNVAHLDPGFVDPSVVEQVEAVIAAQITHARVADLLKSAIPLELLEFSATYTTPAAAATTTANTCSNLLGEDRLDHPLPKNQTSRVARDSSSICFVGLDLTDTKSMTGDSKSLSMGAAVNVNAWELPCGIANVALSAPSSAAVPITTAGTEQKLWQPGAQTAIFDTDPTTAGSNYLSVDAAVKPANVALSATSFAAVPATTTGTEQQLWRLGTQTAMPMSADIFSTCLRTGVSDYLSVDAAVKPADIALSAPSFAAVSTVTTGTAQQLPSFQPGTQTIIPMTTAIFGTATTTAGAKEFLQQFWQQHASQAPTTTANMNTAMFAPFPGPTTTVIAQPTISEAQIPPQTPPPPIEKIVEGASG
ncbi:hypothetical protein N657DRAFT_668121 [Parathielavia appendiculata]|uniref:Uncharacterized protein n=1 Tax=Parathielavia appendiculata TaxID=2587402 RepID=A0AAN6UAP4_9PEZI|nr:hypothetical protein N657DRAFT_668121 [Parathielavia appendiculata]